MFQSPFLARLTATTLPLLLFLLLAVPKAVAQTPFAQAKDPRSIGQDKDNALTQDELSGIRNAVPAVGLLLAKIGDSKELFPRGSAVVVRSDGIVVTSHHVVYDNTTQRIYEKLYLRLYDRSDKAVSPVEHPLEIILLDGPHDLALLRVMDASSGRSSETKLDLPVIELGDEKKLDFLDDLVIIGFPEKGGTSPTLSRGVVQGMDLKDGWIKTDANLLHGNSGGATVNRHGKLVGISTKVESDVTENNVVLGKIGYSRSVNLVRRLLEKLQETESRNKEKGSSSKLVLVRGVVKDARAGNPIAGARVGLLVFGGQLDVGNIITWGGTNADGQFQFEKSVPPGKYTLRAKVIGDFSYAPYSSEVEIKPDSLPLVIELRLAREQ
jgi:S1-C subfamily serine protease